jgi:serine phosphatase RsbU (regulator of sigma subunit)
LGASYLNSFRRYLRPVFCSWVWVLYLFVFQLSWAQPSNEVYHLSIGDVSEIDETIYIPDTWNYLPGNQNWSESFLTDSNRQQVSTYLDPSELSFIDWDGSGWFWISFQIDSSLLDYPLALLPEQHNGASEIYFDGRLVHRIGTFSPDENTFEPYKDALPRHLQIIDTNVHTLAVRYANFDAESFNNYGFTAGFRFLFGNQDYHGSTILETQRRDLKIRQFYLGIMLAFTVIHFLLFVFYPAEKRNLYFALFTGFLTLLSYSILEAEFSYSPKASIFYYRVSLIAWLFTVMYALRFSYSLFYDKMPRIFWGFLAAGLLLATGIWLNQQAYSGIRELFVLIMLFEIFRVLVISFIRKKEGIALIGSGLIVFGGGLLYTSLANLNVFQSDPIWGNVYGSTGLILGMSVYLSRVFAQTNQRLEDKLQEVKHLSEVSLQQERISKQKEMERKLLEAENARKSQELEEARTLQLSMLPTSVPQHPNWDVAVYMQTAQEVGGDYYDFATDADGNLLVAVGDATGHGMKAGIMVATAKSFFHTLAHEPSLISILKRMSIGVKNMNLRMMYMSMMLLRIQNKTVEYTSAGMPPMLHFRKNSGDVVTHLHKGMPLGAQVDYPYTSSILNVESGDILVCLSDGLTELFNEKREQLGVQNVEHLILNNNEGDAEKILTQIVDFSGKWAGTAEQEDDLTLLVMKAR